MLLLDQWAECHIRAAQEKGEFDNLEGTGKPLTLDDDSNIPPKLRAGYRLLKNSGYLPPELELRREAVELSDLMKSINRHHPDYLKLSKKLMLMKLRLQIAGLSTSFIDGLYGHKIIQHMNKEK